MSAKPARRGRPAGPREAGLPIDSSLFFKLARVVNLTARPFVETLARTHQLSLNEWRVMVVVASHPGVAATDVVDATGLDKMSVSRAIAALVRRHRLGKWPDPQDRRRSQLALTAAGLDLYRLIGTRAQRREAQLFGGVGAAEQARFGATLDRLAAALARSDGTPPGSEAEQAGANRAARRADG